MKITATVVLGLVAMSEAKKGGKPSTASTKAAKTKSISLSYNPKSAKAKAFKTQCIDSDSSLSYSPKSVKAWLPKSGKADLSMSMSMPETGSVCLPCSLGKEFYQFDCGTDVGFCTYTAEISTGPIPNVVQCAANDCTPDCEFVEGICNKCSIGPLFGANCPDGDACEFKWTADAPPTCKLSDCLPPPKATTDCGPCDMAPPGIPCPDPPANVEYCQITVENTGGATCVVCNETACPDLALSECFNPPDGGGARKLKEMSNEDRFFNEMFQW